MLNAERVILMTRLAMFEQREGRKNGAAAAYFRSDYVGFKVLGSILSATLVYIIIVGAYILYHLGDILQNVYVTDMLAQGRTLLVYYVLFVGAYALIAWLVYTVRYNRMRRRMKAYFGGLRRLARLTGSGGT